MRQVSKRGNALIELNMLSLVEDITLVLQVQRYKNFKKKTIFAKISQKKAKTEETYGNLIQQTLRCAEPIYP